VIEAEALGKQGIQPLSFCRIVQPAQELQITKMKSCKSLKQKLANY
jgi:hypothetical protein